MKRKDRRLGAWRAYVLLSACLVAGGCSGQPQQAAPQSGASAPARPALPPAAPPADKTGDFDGQKAFAHVEQLVGIGPRTAGSDGIRRAQAYIKNQLQSFGCTVEEDDFSSPTPIGRVAMKNIVAKTPGGSSSVVLFLTHYDTKRDPNFVGANDSGSSTGVMLELARVLCARKPAGMLAGKPAVTAWIAFLDGEEAFQQWSETDSLYGSRQMAARLANTGELKKVKAVILADMVGYRELRFKREENSTGWLTDLVWSTAAGLGYAKHFVQESAGAIEDDHLPFKRRGLPVVDIIQLEDFFPYWHTPEDTLDKISPQSLAIVGHVLLEVLPQLEKRLR